MEKNKRQYRYRDWPMNIAPTDKIWCVSGRDDITGGAGVLEWCFDEKDARIRINLMRQSLEFSRLRAHKYQENKR